MDELERILKEAVVILFAERKETDGMSQAYRYPTRFETHTFRIKVCMLRATLNCLVTFMSIPYK